MTHINMYYHYILATGLSIQIMEKMKKQEKNISTYKVYYRFGKH